jgi:hypothetical protein
MAKVKLKNVRLAFPVLWEPKAVNPGDKPAFSASFLFAPDHPAVKEIERAIDEVAKEKWADKAPAILTALRKADKTCLHEGDLKSQYAGYSGNMFVSARAFTRPLVIDADTTPLVESDGRPYAGCYVNCVLELYAQDNAYGKRVNATLSGVQYYREGEAFSGGRAASVDDFEDVTDGASADDLI